MEGVVKGEGKRTLRAVGEKQRVTRARQSVDSASVTHPGEKALQIKKHLICNPSNVLEVFAGKGQLTEVYESLGHNVTAWDKRLGTGDSYERLLHEAGKYTYGVVDIDSYGFPSRAFPHVFLYIDNGFLLLTFPKPGVQWLNGITRQHLITWWGSEHLEVQNILDKLSTYALMYWRVIDLVHTLDLGRVWRFVFEVHKVKATEYCNVRNRSVGEKIPQLRLPFGEEGTDDNSQATQ